MIKIPVIWLNYTNAPARGYWDQGMLEDVFSNSMWSSGYEFDNQAVEGKGQPYIGTTGGAVVVFAARNQIDQIDRLNADLLRLSWVVLLLTGDEEAVFPIEKILHPNIRIWVMSPHPGRHDKYDKLGTGYPPHMHGLLPTEAPEKSLDYFFAGQITHDRRQQCADALENIKEAKPWNHLEGEFIFSKAFTEGLPHKDYFEKLASAKVAPAPSGPETPDSFRLFEALEAACVPIADTRTNKGDFPDSYWTWFFGGEVPFPILRDYENLRGFTEMSATDYPALNNKIFSWWQNKKREMVIKIRDQISELSGLEPDPNDITVLMPSSPIKSHPATDMIEKTISNIRTQLPNSEIIILQDGVREEDEHHRANYEEYQRRLLWLCNYKWNNIRVLRFEEHKHQSGMTREALKQVTTPLILFAEHDTPVTPDQIIEWDKLSEAILGGQANVIKLHQEALILPEHEHLMLGDIEEIAGAKVRKSFQWSQRPHLASTAFYKKILKDYFSDNSRAFIEHGLYGEMLKDVQNDGLMGWYNWRYYIYTPTEPDPNNIKRSYDLNGRDGEAVYDSIF